MHMSSITRHYPVNTLYVQVHSYWKVTLRLIRETMIYTCQQQKITFL
jgi:hypothetical protein